MSLNNNSHQDFTLRNFNEISKQISTLPFQKVTKNNISSNQQQHQPSSCFTISTKTTSSPGSVSSFDSHKTAFRPPSYDTPPPDFHASSSSNPLLMLQQHQHQPSSRATTTVVDLQLPTMPLPFASLYPPVRSGNRQVSSSSETCHSSEHTTSPSESSSVGENNNNSSNHAQMLLLAAALYHHNEQQRIIQDQIKSLSESTNNNDDCSLQFQVDRTLSSKRPMETHTVNKVQGDWYTNERPMWNVPAPSFEDNKPKPPIVSEHKRVMVDDPYIGSGEASGRGQCKFEMLCSAAESVIQNGYETDDQKAIDYSMKTLSIKKEEDSIADDEPPPHYSLREYTYNEEVSRREIENSENFPLANPPANFVDKPHDNSDSKSELDTVKQKEMLMMDNNPAPVGNEELTEECNDNSSLMNTPLMQSISLNVTNSTPLDLTLVRRRQKRKKRKRKHPHVVTTSSSNESHSGEKILCDERREKCKVRLVFPSPPDKVVSYEKVHDQSTNDTSFMIHEETCDEHEEAIAKNSDTAFSGKDDGGASDGGLQQMRVDEKRDDSYEGFHLQYDDLKSGTRVLFRIGVHFHLGRMSEIYPPDIYGVIVDKERGNKPHIFSREQLINNNDVLLERRANLDDLWIGRRICSFWSDKYHHLFPGVIGSYDEYVMVRGGNVNVELDDGDNRDIDVGQVRLLPQNYPNVNSLNQSKSWPRRRASIIRQLNNCESDNAQNESTKVENSRTNVTEPIFEMKKDDYLKVESENPTTSCGGISSFLPDQSLWRLNKRNENVKRLTLIVNAKIKIKRKRNKFRMRRQRINSGENVEYYVSIIRNETEELKIGDCTVFLSTSRPDTPYIGKLCNFWQNSDGGGGFKSNRMYAGGEGKRTSKKHSTSHLGSSCVQVCWYYHASEVEGGHIWSEEGGSSEKREAELKGDRFIKFKANMLPEGALFESDHKDINDLQTISHKCIVEKSYRKFRSSNSSSMIQGDVEDEDFSIPHYYLAGHYDPVRKRVVLKKSISHRLRHNKF